MFTKGSEWRRWDLHVHTKGTNKADSFVSTTWDEFCVALFQKAIANKIAVIGITDYFSIDNFKKVVKFVDSIDSYNFSPEEKEIIKSILLIPNVELRILPATDSGTMVNIHCLFNPDFVDSLDNHFFNGLKHLAGDKNYPMNRQGITDLGKSTDPSLNDEEAYEKGISVFALSHEQIQKHKENDREFRENTIIAVSNSSHDGASGFQKHYKDREDSTVSSLDGVRQAIYKLCDCIFSGNPQDAEYFVGKKKDSAATVRLKYGSLKPCIHGSDAHTEEKLFKPDYDRYCWIKADPTFNGLRQITYEPFPGERVFIGQVKPDDKKDYKVIKSINFHNARDFPKQIEFNASLCSIIGSRSSGKSALLAYTAAAINLEDAKAKRPNGPGDGFPWDKVDFEYSVEWANGKTNEQSPGKIVYIPQNHLFNMSANPTEIKEKIKPVLENKLPQIGKAYLQTERKINRIREDLGKKVKNWFELNKQIATLNTDLQDLGAKKSIQKEITKVDAEIKEIKEKYKLKSSELKKYQKLSENVATFQQQLLDIKEDLELIRANGNPGEYFESADVHFVPSVEELPGQLIESLTPKLETWTEKLVADGNKAVSVYYKELESRKTALEAKLNSSSQELAGISEKQEKKEFLEDLVGKRAELKSILKEVVLKSGNLTKAKQQLKQIDGNLRSLIDQREEIIKKLIREMESVDQSMLKDLEFGIEAKMSDNDIASLEAKINTKESSRFIVSRHIEIQQVRKDPAKFLEAVYTGKQKINKGNDKQLVATEALGLSETILFTAKMEGDSIGGFSESTMTAGKKALFALRLILAESEETWPLLIDQPEDDLDSRSIFDEIRPFLQEKKKERQILMVSHDANLVIGADSEQVIVANRNGDDRKNQDGLLFNYLSGSIENTKELNSKSIDTLKAQGIREHACQILEGGETAFEHRSNRYAIKPNRT